VIPCYDHPHTVAEVVARTLAHHFEVLLVDDGSSAPTRDVVDRVDGVRVVRHDRNYGKGAALRTGFREAQEAGFSHAVTLDADGQHFPEDIVRLLDAARAEPEAIVLGQRDLRSAGAGFGSRFGCRHSNFWTWIETGLRLPDTQTGFRCYPLAPIDGLHLTTTGFDFEIEVLVVAAWNGIPIRSVPVRVFYPPPGEHVSHLRPFVDFLRIGRLNTKLVFLRLLLPAPFLAVLTRRQFHALPVRARIKRSLREVFVHEPGSPRRIALSSGLGFFMGIAPIWGFQIAATLLVAHMTRLSKAVAVVASHIALPVFVPAILYGSLVLGRTALGLRAGDQASLEVGTEDVGAWLVGSLLLATLVAIVGGALVYVLVRAARRGRAPRAS
jgi:uncharacterized protein (DUF2062 family)